ncbi:MAG: glycosyltransferase family 39 protein, partial [Planctomycetes bacterium]|nr:glycosyltransferase family 39 protein [Planctomycetota bacterium]
MKSERSVWIPFVAIVALAFLVRFVFLLEARGVPLFHAPVVDAKSYWDWSERIVAGDWVGDQVFYQAPLYPYFLACVKLVVGSDLWNVRLVQIALGALACGVLFLAGRELLSRRAGVVAGVILALYAPAIFFDALIQKANLGLVWTTLLLFALARVQRSASLARLVLVGVFLGLLMLTREESLLLVPVLAAWIVLFAARGQPLARRGALFGAFALGLALVLTPVAARNAKVGGEFVLTTSQAGTNFYIGNGPAATGLYVPLRPGRSDTAYERVDAVELAEAARGQPLARRGALFGAFALG